MPMALEVLAVIATVPRSRLAAEGAVIEIVGAWLLTVTEMVADVAVLPAVSRATAVSVWLPPATAVVFKEIE
jgi:hypothetical protein